ncbi:MAG TPA: metal ABC transporter substrate-binding protein, partial [Paracoccus sp. (in: a-proteobacteria)]|uniref:metal ABC transporter substrate-binding protein n=1 Tax=Paracoccus sp. TaxID=267 RepID=UPI002B6EC249
HAWLDPENGTVWLNAIAEALSQRDPENAATYRANAEAGVAEVKAADAALAATLAPLKDRRFVVFHDAYGYFTDHYGLAPAIAVSLGDASSPSAARLQQVRGELGDQKAVCAFPEANHDPRLLQTAIEGTGIRLGDAIAPEGKASGSTPTYPGFLSELGQTIATCLSK